MSFRELMEWAAFERVSGPILLHERIDYAASLLAYVTAASQGVKIKGRPVRFKDFAVDWSRKVPTEAEAAAALGRMLEAAASQPSPHSGE